jgi:hypothetical protein
LTLTVNPFLNAMLFGGFGALISMWSRMLFVQKGDWTGRSGCDGWEKRRWSPTEIIAFELLKDAGTDEFKRLSISPSMKGGSSLRTASIQASRGNTRW